MAIVNELHKPIRHNFPRRKVITYGIDDLWQADILDLSNLKSSNKQYRYILNCIDVFSKYVFAIPLKNKSTKPVVDAFKFIFESQRVPDNLQTDKGLEFTNKDIQALFKQYNVHWYSTNSELKASVVERFNRTLRDMMWKKFTFNSNYKWVDMLPELINTYNNKIHRTINMTPVEASRKENESKLKHIFRETFPNNPPKFKIGDTVRISKNKRIFTKGSTKNWTPELFTICKIIYSNPITYHIKDYKENIIDGCFYENELQKTTFKDVYLIEKVLKRKGNKIYVKFLGFDNDHNAWVDANDVVC